MFVDPKLEPHPRIGISIGKIIEEYEREKIMCLNTEFKRNNRIHSERTGQYQKKKKKGRKRK